MKRGEIYYIEKHDAYGSEIRKARPGVIVSNDMLNQTSDVVEVVYLTTQPKKELPTHVCINSTGCESTALCEQINAVDVRRVGTYCGTCTTDEMLAIDRALCASLDLARARMDIPPRAAMRVSEPDSRLLAELERVKAERDRYAKMLDYFLSDEEGEG
jgi:mRNA-degrading endonuclease toxin of MazEF toxin-antitoxin module